MESLLLLVPFLNLWLMSAIKAIYARGFQDVATRNHKLRIILLVLSFIGVFANSLLNGPVVDASVAGEFITNVILAIIAAVTSHVTYKAVKSA